MIEIVKKNKCTGCTACKFSCPTDSIKMVADKDGFLYPNIDKDKCIECKKCINICPINSYSYNSDTESSSYAAINHDDKVRKESSSGGIFTLLAEKVIAQGGVVFGVAFNKDFQVEHTYTETFEGIKAFRGSKYVQSKVGDSYFQVEQFLKSDRKVLFTGTPCQVGGLLSYLKEDYDNLITQDVICHGVPSPMVWNRYVDYRKKKAGGESPRKISFRLKDEGWKRFYVSFAFANDTEYRQTLDRDKYMQTFLKDLSLRPSCYECNFKFLNRKSDITLADFWGIQNVMPEMDDDKGTSLVFVHSKKGKELFDSIKESIVFKESDKLSAVKYNTAMTRSVIQPKTREKFLYRIKADDFAKVSKKFCKISLKVKIRKTLGRVKRLLIKNSLEE